MHILDIKCPCIIHRVFATTGMLRSCARRLHTTAATSESHSFPCRQRMNTRSLSPLSKALSRSYSSCIIGEAFGRLACSSSSLSSSDTLRDC